jgi:hypothetical protein
MLEVSKNSFVVKAKILGMKIINKDSKFWVLFYMGKSDKEEQSVFSAPFTSELEARAFLDACATSL